MGRKDKSYRPDHLNSITYNYYYNMLKSIALSTFKWDGLPLEVDERFLELTLFETGMAIFFKDDVADLFVALTTQIGGQLDIYRQPMQRVAYSVNNYNVHLNPSNSVLIYNNQLHLPDIDPVRIYAYKLTEIDRTMQVNVAAQKTPLFIRTTPEQKLTMENVLQQYNENSFAIFGDKGASIKPLEVISTESPYIASELQFLKSQVLSEALGYFGVESNPTTKKERMVADEVNSTMGFIIANRYNRLKARNQACDIINRMFGLDIHVTFESDFKTGETGQTTGVQDLLKQLNYDEYTGDLNE